MRENTYAKALAALSTLEAEERSAADAWKTAFPRDPAWPMGLAPDEIRLSLEYRAFRARHQQAMDAIRKFMPGFLRRWKKEYRATQLELREARRAARAGKDAMKRDG